MFNKIAFCHKFFLITLALMVRVSYAVTLTPYTDFEAFNHAISQENWGKQTIFFDNIEPGTQIISNPNAVLTPPITNPDGSTSISYIAGPSGTVLSFGYNINGLTMKVANGFGTTTFPNYLGLNDPGNYDQFIAGDTFSIYTSRLDGSRKPIDAIGMFFLTSDLLTEKGDIQFRFFSITDCSINPNNCVETPANIQPFRTPTNGGFYAYFLGAVSDTPFINVSIGSAPNSAGKFLYNVDDITTAVPEPSILALFSLGLVGIAFGKRRKVSEGL